jgi:hypothetical protein
MARLALIATATAIVCAALVIAYRGAGRQEHAVESLDRAKIIVVRTPGGMLEVATLQKAEEFGWQAKYECPWIDCSFALKPTISKVRVQVHYVYRLPLADTWELRLQGDHYELSVPDLRPKSPVAFDTSTLQVESSTGWFSPTQRSNEQALMRQLGPELEKRAGQDAYIRAVLPHAEKTVQEFAAKWMTEQKVAAGKPIKVSFRYSP